MIDLKINGRIWLETSGGERFIGVGRMELLEHIQQSGSINLAAKAMNMSYKRAWDLVQSFNRLAEQPMVVTQTGGQKGGGATLTKEGLVYLKRYQELLARFNQFMAEESF